jgi:hypothetical protein
MRRNSIRLILVSSALGALALHEAEGLALRASQPVRALAHPLAAQVAGNPGYQWTAELVSYDAKAKTMTVKAAYQEHINRYIGDFKSGDRVLVTWSTSSPGQTDSINYVGRYEGSGSNWGYVLPVEFVSADTAARRLTFTVAVTPMALRTLKSAAPGQPINVRTPFDQPKEIAVGVVVERSIAAAKQQS